MTSTTEAPRRAPWAVRGLWVALALSLTLNVFVAGGLTWSMLHRGPPRPPPPVERLVNAARRLDLTPNQRDALQIFGIAARGLARDMRQANAPLLRDLWTQMAMPQPDPASINALSDKVLENRRTYQRGMAANLMKFLATLSPDQRKAFTDNVMPRGGPGPAPPPGQ